MLNLVEGHKISDPGQLSEGYEIIDEVSLLANVNAEKILDVFQHFIVIHDEQLFFILELPVNSDREEPIVLGIVRELHKDVYYIDGCSRDECLVLMDRYGELLINDGISKFGFGGHESQDEIMLDKYNLVNIYSQHIEEYEDFFEPHEVEKVDNLVTAWDTFSQDTPGQSERYDFNGKTVFDLPEALKEWGIYLAETRTK